MKGKYINCKECGKEVYTYNNIVWGWAKYCSIKCYNIYRKRESDKKIKYNICLHCDKEFKVLPRYYEQKFCSEQCMGLSKRKRKISNCKYCGKEFESKYYNGRAWTKYCNQSCYFNYLRELNNIPDNIPDIICKQCGDTFKVKHRSQFKKRKFCSIKCSNKNRILIRDNKGKITGTIKKEIEI